ncbi:hypothetical protein P167DRAFT_421407 [Morchella conica CCBAS932]|uniref:Secreted protein n=1 Tax=Morchella conica CCBAS932 TaxID=1392247 RepID=A0A3N4K9T0_9PEZI|nr:hypothetical protein P167DRAFT_421407 [Morchella conica CCBAS932]
MNLGGAVAVLFCFFNVAVLFLNTSASSAHSILPFGGFGGFNGPVKFRSSVPSWNRCHCGGSLCRMSVMFLGQCLPHSKVSQRMGTMAACTWGCCGADNVADAVETSRMNGSVMAGSCIVIRCFSGWLVKECGV